jgi:trigger factor
VKTSVSLKGKWERQLAIEVPIDRLEAEFSQAYRKYQQRLELPGFRKGKVPLKTVVARYGESIRNTVIGDLLPTVLEEATREAGLVPASPPRLTKLDHEPGQPLNLTVDLDIWPEMEVQHYDQLKATRLVHQVADEEIGRQLEELRQRHATERDVDQPLARGNVLIADLQRLDQGDLPIIGERYEERYFLIGTEGAPGVPFEEQLLGIRAGEQRRVRFVREADAENPEQAGKEERFSVTVRQVRERQLPELDDEFAKDLGGRFQSLEELRQQLARQLQQNWEYIARQRLRSELLNGLIEKNPFELPAGMVDNYLESLHREEERRQRRAPEPEPEHEPEHEHSQEERQMAVRRLKSAILVEGVRKQAGIEVSEEQFGAYLQKRAEEVGAKLEDLQRSPRLGELRKELEEDEVFAFLLARAQVEEQAV